MRVIAIAALALVASPAHATPAADVAALYGKMLERVGSDAVPQPTFASIESDAIPHEDGGGFYSLGDWNAAAKKPNVALAADGAAAWLIDDTELLGDCGGGASCGKHIGGWHATAVFARTAKGWEPVAVDVDSPGGTGSRSSASPVVRAVDPKAQPAVDAFTASLGDPKRLAASVSARKDVALYGSDAGERYEGAAVAKKLAAWKLAFAVDGDAKHGLAAGLASPTVAWVAADVLGGKAGAKATRYRVLFVYERTADKWQLVQAHFTE